MTSPTGRNSNKKQSLHGAWHSATGLYWASEDPCRTRYLVICQAARFVFTRTEAKSQPADSEPHTLPTPSQPNQQSCTSPEPPMSPRTGDTRPCRSKFRPFPGRIRLYNSKLWVRTHLFPSIKTSSKGQKS